VAGAFYFDNISGEDVKLFLLKQMCGPKCLLFLDWCRGCFTTYVVFLFSFLFRCASYSFFFLVCLHDVQDKKHVLFCALA